MERRDFLQQAVALLASFACVLVLSACTSKATAQEPDAQRLVGRWSQVFRFNNIRDEIAIDLEPDATIRVKVRRHSGSGILEYAGTGKWRVEEGHFVCNLDFPGPADAVNHLIGKRRIIAVTDWQWVSDYVNGEQMTAWRYPK